MPLYTFDCVEHGRFQAVRAMAQMPCPVPCEACGVPATRLFDAPQIIGTPYHLSEQWRVPTTGQADLMKQYERDYEQNWTPTPDDAE